MSPLHIRRTWLLVMLDSITVENPNSEGNATFDNLELESEIGSDEDAEPEPSNAEGPDN